jgi:AcrR family transcriptional regulator
MTAAQSPAPESQRGKRTRSALLAAGHRLLAERSIDALAIDDIVQAAGVAKGSFYNHFEGKQELAAAIREDIRQDIEAEVSRVNAQIDDPAARVSRAVAVYVAYLLASPERANVILRINTTVASADNPLNAGVMRDVAAGLRTGRFVVPSVKAGALFVIGACQIALMHAVEEPGRDGVLITTQQLGALMLRGLGVGFSEAEALTASAIHELVPREAPSAAAPG